MTKHYFEYINEVVRKYWDRPALTDFGGKTNYTYGGMANEIVRLCGIYKQLGLKEGDKIAICSKNCSNWGIAFLAIEAYKGVSVNILPDFTAESIQNLVNHSDAKALFIGNHLKDKINIDEMPNLEAVLVVEDFSLLYSKRNITIDNSTIYVKPDSIHFPTDNFDDLALINYTSGTTSAPKGVMLTHRNLSSNATYGQEGIKNQPGWCMLNMLPLAHMFGLMFEFIYQLCGGCHVYFLAKTPTPTILMKAFAEVKPYMVLTVPLVIEKIFKNKIFPILHKPIVHTLWKTPLVNIILRKKIYNQLMKAFGGNLQYLIIGGAALNEEVETCLKEIKFPYTVGYGMTECAPIVGYAHWKEFKRKSCGKIVDRMEIKVDSQDPENQPGELLVKGENVMLGYYKNEEATKATFTSDGWLRTGDLGIIDKNGNIFIRGRNKNMILGASGQNIYPEEIEDKLNSLDGVVESVVVERNGKLIGLVFPDAKKEAIKELMKENLQKLNKLLPGYSKVSDIEIMDKEFEKTPKRSIKRFLYK